MYCFEKTTVNVIVLFITYFMKKEKQLHLKMTVEKKGMI